MYISWKTLKSLQILTLYFSQEFISMVEKCVEDAEEKVNIAEMEVGGNHFKKMLKSVPKFLGVSVSFVWGRFVN